MHLLRPSVLAHIFSGLITLYAIMLYFKIDLTPKENFFAVILFGILITAHGISHFYLESLFDNDTKTTDSTNLTD